MVVPFASPTGRWVLAATVLGSGLAFLDGTVVNVALPAIRRDLGGGLLVQQWVLDGYLLTLSALLLLGGALGDRYGRRRVFLLGLAAFTLASVACGLAPTGIGLIVARAVQGVGGALLVPVSLALLNAAIRGEDRGRAVGAWAGMSGVASAVGPFVGGWLVDAVSWRLVFFLNVPLALAAGVVTVLHVPESRDESATGSPDVAGAATITLGLAGLIYALIEAPAHGWSPAVVVAAVSGGVALVAFLVIESVQDQPLLPLGLFRSAQFSGANLTTLAVYAALGGALFLLALQLQESLGYSALRAGLALLPATLVMLLLSSRIGALSGRTGPRLPMTVGPVVAGVGLGLMARVTPGSHYADATLPAVLVFGLGLSITVAPLTATVLSAVEDRHAGAASGVNNAVARTAGLLAVAILPAVSGIESGNSGGLGHGFVRAMVITAVLCGVGGLIAVATIRTGSPTRPWRQPGVNHGCGPPCMRERDPCTLKDRTPPS